MKKDKRIEFRLSEIEEAALKKAANKEGFTVSQLIRFYLRKILNKGN